MKTIFVTSLLLISGSLFAGECMISIDRSACPGKEAEMLKPYNGKNPTTEKKTFASAEECSKFAEKSSKIIRKGTLASKKVTGTFDGTALEKMFEEKKDCK